MKTRANGKPFFAKKNHKPDPKIRPKPIRGSKENCRGLKIANKTNYIWLSVSGLDTQTNPDEIKSYLEENGVSATICEKLITRTERKYSSFKVQVPAEHRGELLDCGFWPVGLTVNDFLNLRKMGPHMRKTQRKTPSQGAA